ncbi:MAG: recombinase family protein [Oscillospiraceae bacterium]|nr:recombinase family protein [Oscillospiraceae bacterium]
MEAPQKTVRMIPAKPEPQTRRAHHQDNTAAYCRVSTDKDEQQLSYENQCAFYTDFIQKNPEWRFAGIFADEGITGTSTMKRDGFNRMIRQCRAGRIDLILTKAISRFARNTVDALHYVRQLKAMGIGVIFEKEGIDTRKATNEFLLTIFASLAQAESESISQNVKRGKQWSAAQGNVSMPYASFLGYRRGPDGKPEIVPEEAAVVREIYERFLSGDSLLTIAQSLTTQGIRTPRGCEIWAITSIRSILRSEKYKGCALLQKTYIEDCISKKVRVNHGELPQYYIENSHPAIIERAIWDRAQEELARRAGKRKVKEVGTKTEQGKYSSKYALTELLVCGDCGTPYRRVTWSRNGQKKIVWRCINRLDYGTKYCKKSPTLKEDAVQAAVVKALTHLALDETGAMENLRLLIEAGMRGDAPDERAALRLRIAELTSAMLELVAANTVGGVDDEGDDAQYAGLSAEIQALQARADELDGARKDNERAIADLEGIIEAAEKVKFLAMAFDDKIVRQLIACVKVVSGEKLLVIFRSGLEKEVAMS